MPDIRFREGAILLLLTASITAPLRAEPSPDRQAELLHRLKHDCGSCHGMTLKGGLGPALLPSTLTERSDEGLVDVILNGRPGTPMPPWAFEIGRDDVVWLVRRMKEGIADAP